MILNGTHIQNEDLAEEFAKMFEKKINDITQTTSINNEVFNGSTKVNVQDKNFMSTLNIRNAILSLKTKNSEGYYKVGKNLLCNRFKQLNNKIDYHWFNESLNSYKIKCKKLLL